MKTTIVKNDIAFDETNMNNIDTRVVAHVERYNTTHTRQCVITHHDDDEIIVEYNDANDDAYALYIIFDDFA